MEAKEIWFDNLIIQTQREARELAGKNCWKKALPLFRQILKQEKS